MELETIGRVTMSDRGLEVCRKVNDIDGRKRAFLDYSASELFDREGMRVKVLTANTTSYLPSQSCSIEIFLLGTYLCIGAPR